MTTTVASTGLNLIVFSTRVPVQHVLASHRARLDAARSFGVGSHRPHLDKCTEPACDSPQVPPWYESVRRGSRGVLDDGTLSLGGSEEGEGRWSRAEGTFLEPWGDIV